jgi:hypothetical protein
MLSGVQVLVCEVERLVNEGVKALFIISFRIDEFLLNNQLLAVVKNVHYITQGLNRLL